MAALLGDIAIVYVRKCGTFTTAKAIRAAGGGLMPGTAVHTGVCDGFEGEVYGTIRDPWTRQASLWAFLKRKGYPVGDFEPWLREQCETRGYTAEVREVHGGVGNLDGYLATDRLDEALPALGIPYQGHHHRNPDAPDYREWYTAELEQLVADAESELVECFDFEPWTPTPWALR